ncbi:MAG: ribonuclease HII [Rhodothermales bacterium]
MEAWLRERGHTHIAGTDEAGRGCLAGPVVAAAVILPEHHPLDGLADSKTLSAARREDLAPRIREHALAWAVADCTPEEIDERNILWASMEAMRRALERLRIPPDYVLIDGNTMIPSCRWPARPVIKGDARCASISAASILAKTHRDALMKDLHSSWPAYGWDANVGYPTAAHYDALRRHGPTPLHRQSFRLS